MGNFYTNFTLYKTEPKRIVKSLRGMEREAYVSKPQGDCLFVYDKVCDDQDVEEIKQVGQRLSRDLNVPVFAIMNHDDDILCYWLFDQGKVLDEYNSNPGYFDGEEGSPRGGNADLLAQAFSALKRREAIESILQGGEEEYDFAIDRHEALAQALGIPFDYACLGYGSIETEDFPGDADINDFTFVEPK